MVRATGLGAQLNRLRNGVPIARDLFNLIDQLTDTLSVATSKALGGLHQLRDVLRLFAQKLVCLDFIAVDKVVNELWSVTFAMASGIVNGTRDDRDESSRRKTVEMVLDCGANVPFSISQLVVDVLA